MECRMCGYEFDPKEVKDDCDESSCCGCEECNYVVCPNCGYSNSFDYDVDAANYCGLGIYIPQSNKSTWNPYFKTLEWYEASGWSEVSFSWGF